MTYLSGMRAGNFSETTVEGMFPPSEFMSFWYKGHDVYHGKIFFHCASKYKGKLFGCDGQNVSEDCVSVVEVSCWAQIMQVSEVSSS